MSAINKAARCVYHRDAARKQYTYAVPARAQVGDEVRRPSGYATIVGFTNHDPGNYAPAALTGRHARNNNAAPTPNGDPSMNYDSNTSTDVSIEQHEAEIKRLRKAAKAAKAERKAAKAERKAMAAQRALVIATYTDVAQHSQPEARLQAAAALWRISQ